MNTTEQNHTSLMTIRSARAARRRSIRREWIKVCAGSYKSTSGWVIERSVNGGWNVINPEGGVFDNLPTLKQAQRFYSNILTEG